MSRVGRYLPCGVAVLARIGGRHEPCVRVATPASRRPRRPLGVIKIRTRLSTVLAVICCRKWLFWPVSVATMSCIDRHLLSEVAAMARIGGRYEPYWPLFAL